MPYFIGAALAFLGNKIISVLFFIGTSFLAKGLITTLITIGLAYFAVTKLEAYKLVSGYITNALQDSGTSLGGYTVQINSLGTLIQLLRIEDIIYVYLSAIISGYLIRLLTKAISIARVTLPA